MNEPMTAQELASKFNISLSSLTTNFARTAKSIKEKHNIVIEKAGRGSQARYFIKSFERTDPLRALTIYESQEKNALPIERAAALMDIQFLIFIGIVTCPLRVFRGSYFDLLKYLDLDCGPEDINKVREILRDMQQ